MVGSYKKRIKGTRAREKEKEMGDIIMPRGRPKGSKNKPKPIIIPPTMDNLNLICGCFVDSENIVHQCHEHYTPTSFVDKVIHQRRVR